MSAIFFRAPNMFGKDYTKRQNDILNGDIPFEEVRTTELVAIIKKAVARADNLSLSIAENMYYNKTHPDDYVPSYTRDEAKKILQSLTPWEIHWKT